MSCTIGGRAGRTCATHAMPLYPGGYCLEGLGSDKAPPKKTCGWCKGNPIGDCTICQSRPSTPETYADDPPAASSSETAQRPRYVVTDYHAGLDDRPYRDLLRTPDTDEVVDRRVVLEEAFRAASAVDGDEIEIVVRKTGRRPFGDRRVALVSPHTYEREPCGGESPKPTASGTTAWAPAEGSAEDRAARALAAIASRPKRPHIVDGEFQSDKYPTTPRGKVPLSTEDPTAQDLLWQYAQRRRAVDAEFADDLEWALRKHGYIPPESDDAGDVDRT